MIDGNFAYALQVLIKNSDENTLKIWDKLRGNDWYVSTKLQIQMNEYEEYERLKLKFEE
jgi:hypothetical protein